VLDIGAVSLGFIFCSVEPLGLAPYVPELGAVEEALSFFAAAGRVVVWAPDWSPEVDCADAHPATASAPDNNSAPISGFLSHKE